METKSILSRNLKYKRKQIGLTQEQMAKKLDVKRSRYAVWEEDRAEPPLKIITQLAAFHKVKIDELVKKDLSLFSYS